MLLPFQILPDTLFYILCFQDETAFNSNLNICMLKQSIFRTNQLEMGIPETPDCAQSEKYPFYSTLNQSNRRRLCEQETCWFTHSSSKTTAQTCLSLKLESPSVFFKLEFMGPASGVIQSVSREVTKTRGTVVLRLVPVMCISRRKTENFFKGCEHIVCIFPKQSGYTI